MFEVTKGNVKILFESPFLVADYVYKNTNNWRLSSWILNRCGEMSTGDMELIEFEYVLDEERIVIEKAR
jgi:hypothetical protein